MKGTLLKSLDEVTPEERHRFYKMLGIRLTAEANGDVELNVGSSAASFACVL